MRLLKAIIALSALAVTTAHATPVEVELSVDATAITFTYDDAVLTDGSGSPFGQGGVSYLGTSFTVGGISQFPPFYIEIYNNIVVNGTLYDLVYFTAGSATDNASPLVQLACSNDCLANSSLSQLTGMSLADFSSTTLNNYYPGPYGTNGGFTGGLDIAALTITAVSAPVPEPGTLALLGLGLAGMGMARRKKKV